MRQHCCSVGDKSHCHCRHYHCRQQFNHHCCQRHSRQSRQCRTMVGAAETTTGLRHDNSVSRFGKELTAPRVIIAVASETRVTATSATATAASNSIITAAHATAVKAANAGRWSGPPIRQPDCGATAADYGSDCRGSQDCRKARMMNVVVAVGQSNDSNPRGVIVTQRRRLMPSTETMGGGLPARHQQQQRANKR